MSQLLRVALTAFLALTTLSPAPESGPVAPDKIPVSIRDAVAAADRPDADKALDAGRQPAQLLAFFRIAPGMKVADLFAGGGYTTELLARVVGPQGKVYSQNASFPPELAQVEQAWHERLAKPLLANVTPIRQNFDGDFLPVPPESLDAVLINLNYHDLVLRGVDRAHVNGAVFRALKKGGVYGVVDHSAKPGSGAEGLQLHRIEQPVLVKEVEQAGFVLDAASSVLRRPDDDMTWSTSPRVAGEKRGTSDRFVLRFVKK
jgi:predicted methyltransferase